MTTIVFVVVASVVLLTSILLGLHADRFAADSSRHQELSTTARGLALGAVGVAAIGTVVIRVQHRRRHSSVE